ncbi:MAG: hypothetical protein ACI395_01050, partial [Candidatus Cryptobacteroides sp.]
MELSSRQLLFIGGAENFGGNEEDDEYIPQQLTDSRRLRATKSPLDYFVLRLRGCEEIDEEDDEVIFKPNLIFAENFGENEE